MDKIVIDWSKENWKNLFPRDRRYFVEIIHVHHDSGNTNYPITVVWLDRYLGIQTGKFTEDGFSLNSQVQLAGDFVQVIEDKKDIYNSYRYYYSKNNDFEKIIREKLKHFLSGFCEYANNSYLSFLFYPKNEDTLELEIIFKDKKDVFLNLKPEWLFLPEEYWTRDGIFESLFQKLNLNNWD